MTTPPDDPESWREDPTGAGTKPAHGRKTLRVVPRGERDPRKEIILTPNVHETTTALISALGTDDDLFRRAGALSHVIREDGEKNDDGSWRIVPGTPTIRNAPLSWLTGRVSMAARCLKFSAKDEKYHHVEPPVARVGAVLEHGTWPEIRDLRGIIEAPTMRPDGTILQAAGYDPATRLLHEPNAEFPIVADAPSHSDCVLAYARLMEPFRDFPYVAESHRAAAIAGVLTLLARPAIAGSVPCWLFDASAARSGKSLQVDVISLIATGRVASRLTYPEQDDELEKVISSYALRGAAVLNFDNVARKFGGAALDKVITAIDLVDMRMLGSSDIRSFAWRAVVFASGNNVACKGDMLPRVIAPRLESPLANPEKRADLLHPELRVWVAEHRTELAHAALTILRGYVAAGRPDMGCPRWGGFEAWSRLIPHALRWVGAEDPMGARRGLDGDEDPERVNAAALVDGWERLCRDMPQGLTAKAALTVLYPTSRREEREPDGHDDLREAIESLTYARPGIPPGARQLGDALRLLKGKIVGGMKLVSLSAMGHTARWRAIKA